MTIKSQQARRVQPIKLGSRKHNVAALIVDIAPAIVATGLVVYALVALLSVELKSDDMSAPELNSEERIADVGFPFTTLNGKVVTQVGAKVSNSITTDSN